MIEIPRFDGGKTLKILAWDCKSTKITDEGWCARFLLKLCTVLGLTRWMGPYCARLTHPEDSTKDGASAVLMIMESHLAIHTWGEEKAVRIIIDSCVDFNTHLAVKYVEREMESDQLKVETVGT